MAEMRTKESVAFESGIIKYNAFGFLSLATLGAGLPAFKNNLFKFFKGGQKQLNIRGINAMLFFCIIILAAYFVNNIFASLEKINHLDFSLPHSAKPSEKSQDSLRTKELVYYIDKIKQRDIFRMGPKPGPDAVAEVISSKAAEATKNLKLVGISWSDNPDAIIEDNKGLRTFFVKKGQMIGEIKVESISKDKVMLRYGEEVIELR
jgi:hypothetical protein